MAQQITFQTASLALSQDAVRIILQSLGEVPYRVSAPVIHEIERQLLAQFPTAPQAAPPASPAS